MPTIPMKIGIYYYLEYNHARAKKLGIVLGL